MKSMVSLRMYFKCGRELKLGLSTLTLAKLILVQCLWAKRCSALPHCVGQLVLEANSRGKRLRVWTNRSQESYWDMEDNILWQGAHQHTTDGPTERRGSQSFRADEIFRLFPTLRVQGALVWRGERNFTSGEWETERKRERKREN